MKSAFERKTRCTLRVLFVAACLVLFALGIAFDAAAQTPAASPTATPATSATPAPQAPAATTPLTQAAAQTPPRGVVQLRAGLTIEGQAKLKGLSRKRFYLIRGAAEDLAAFEKEGVGTLPSRDCYYKSKNASAGLMKWLEDNDCESLFCREVEQKEIADVKEFGEAYKKGLSELRNEELARKWLATNLPADIRDGFYTTKQRTLAQILKRGADTKKAELVQSVMTDRNGTAYFTNLEPGAYVISNLVPTETGKTAVIWNCPVTVKAGSQLFTVSDKKGRLVKCVGVEQPPPPCGQ